MHEWKTLLQLHSASHFTAGVGRLLHAVAVAEEVEQVLHGNRRVGVATQREDLPQQHAVRPPEQAKQQFSQALQLRLQGRPPGWANQALK